MNHTQMIRIHGNSCIQKPLFEHLFNSCGFLKLQCPFLSARSSSTGTPRVEATNFNVENRRTSFRFKIRLVAQQFQRNRVFQLIAIYIQQPPQDKTRQENKVLVPQCKHMSNLTCALLYPFLMLITVAICGLCMLVFSYDLPMASG